MIPPYNDPHQNAVNLSRELRLLNIDNDDLPVTGDDLRLAVLDAGYDGIRIRSESLNLGGDQLVVYRDVREHGELGATLTDPAHDFTKV